VGNPDLRPEKAWNAEVGAALAAGTLTLYAAYFHRHATDLIDFVRSSSSEVFRARNVRQADTDGVEASADWTRGRPSFLTQLRVQAAYVFVDLASLSAAADGAGVVSAGMAAGAALLGLSALSSGGAGCS